MAKIRVKMFPSPDRLGESGIKRVIDAYHKYGPRYGIEYVDRDEQEFDVVAIHAGTHPPQQVSHPIVAHIHGLYWTADYDAAAWEWRANADVIDTMRHAEVITVPSEWVAETVRRDMRINPIVVPHGIDVNEWTVQNYEPYVLWNKNRDMDVCSTYHLGELARRAPDTRFISTFAPPHEQSNVDAIGLLSHDKMRQVIEHAGIYLSTTKETFGIGILEAMAAGVPVLGFDHGGNSIIVEHGMSGYLARPNDYDDLKRGLDYIKANRDSLSYYARERAKKFTWDRAMLNVCAAYEIALEIWRDRMHRPYTIPESEYLSPARIPRFKRYPYFLEVNRSSKPILPGLPGTNDLYFNPNFSMGIKNATLSAMGISSLMGLYEIGMKSAAEAMRGFSEQVQAEIDKDIYGDGPIDFGDLAD